MAGVKNKTAFLSEHTCAKNPSHAKHTQANLSGWICPAMHSATGVEFRRSHSQSNGCKIHKMSGIQKCLVSFSLAQTNQRQPVCTCEEVRSPEHWKQKRSIFVFTPRTFSFSLEAIPPMIDNQRMCCLLSSSVMKRVPTTQIRDLRTANCPL